MQFSEALGILPGDTENRQWRAMHELWTWWAGQVRLEGSRTYAWRIHRLLMVGCRAGEVAQLLVEHSTRGPEDLITALGVERKKTSALLCAATRERAATRPPGGCSEEEGEEEEEWRRATGGDRLVRPRRDPSLHRERRREHRDLEHEERLRQLPRRRRRRRTASLRSERSSRGSSSRSPSPHARGGGDRRGSGWRSSSKARDRTPPRSRGTSTSPATRPSEERSEPRHAPSASKSTADAGPSPELARSCVNPYRPPEPDDVEDFHENGMKIWSARGNANTLRKQLVGTLCILLRTAF